MDVWQEGYTTEGWKRDIAVKHVQDGITFLPVNHRLADALTYPLLFPRGDDTWAPHTITLTRTTQRKKFVTAHQYLRYMLHHRENNDYYLLHGRLSQEWVVNFFVKIENERLNYYRFNQRKIKADLYVHTHTHTHTHTSHARHVPQHVHTQP